MSSQHDDFLEGFADALGLKDPRDIQYHYELWLFESGPWNVVELIDFESAGYETGLEVGAQYKQKHQL